MSNLERRRGARRRYWRSHWFFYLIILPAFLDVLIFRYFPMYGVQIAFRQYKGSLGIWGSKWVGMKYFIRFLESPACWQMIRNTILLSVYSLLWGFPIPILLAFMVNELRSRRFKKILQMATYMPHFISTVAVVGLINLLLDRNAGIFNLFRALLGREQVSYLSMPSAFRTIYVASGVWQSAGWSSIIYIAALSSVDVEILEAATLDGANRMQKIRYIDFPTILPTVVILLILSCGSILSVGFEKIFLMQNDLVIDVSQVVATYTYKLGILGGQFGYTAAIGLFNSVINALILVSVNFIANRLGQNSLW